MAACGPRSFTLMVVSAIYVGTVALIMPMPNPQMTREAHYRDGQYNIGSGLWRDKDKRTIWATE